jgi:uncharacterized protein HemX
LTKIKRADEISEREVALRKQIENVQIMIKAVDASRDRLESGLESLNYSSEEIKNQVRILKERQTWLIAEQDKLRKEISQ